MFYWFIFEDGYRVCTRGFSRLEEKHMTNVHGKIVNKYKA